MNAGAEYEGGVACSSFADYCFEAISVEDNKLVLWVAHEEE